MSRRNPFKRHRFPRNVILLAVRWYCRQALFCRDVRDMLAERGVTVDASTRHSQVIFDAGQEPSCALISSGQLLCIPMPKVEGIGSGVAVGTG